MGSTNSKILLFYALTIVSLAVVLVLLPMFFLQLRMSDWKCFSIYTVSFLLLLFLPQQEHLPRFSPWCLDIFTRQCLPIDIICFFFLSEHEYRVFLFVAIPLLFILLLRTFTHSS